MKIKLSIDPDLKAILISDTVSQQQVAYIPSLTQGTFYDFMTHHFCHIEEAIIPPVGSYRNVLYGIYPGIKIVIDQEAMEHYFEDVKITQDYELEVAATQVGGPCEADQDISPYVFIKRFYACGSKEEAEALYNWWQINIPIQQQGLYRYIRLIEYFDQEIFNYFPN